MQCFGNRIRTGICLVCRIPHTHPVPHLQGLRHTTWRSYNSRGLLEPPEANGARGRAGAEMYGIELDGWTEDDGDMWHLYWRSTIVGFCADCQTTKYIYRYML